MTKPHCNTLLILSGKGSRYVQLIENENFADLKIIAALSVEQARDIAGQCNILLTSPDLAYEILPHMKKLQWYQSTWAGVNRLMGDECRKDYLLTGVKGVFGPIMAEYVFCYILMHARNVLECYECQKMKQWKMPMPGLLRGKKIGIMGVGSIGVAIGKTAKVFEMITYGYARSTVRAEAIDKIFGSGELLEFVSELDYLVSVLPQTDDTRHLIDASVIQAMKPGLILINVGRGNVIDEAALIHGLENRAIAGAVLDVFQEEPLPVTHPLWDAPNVIITSHKAALTYPEDIVPIFNENYRRFSSGRELQFVIDFNKGY